MDVGELALPKGGRISRARTATHEENAVKARVMPHSPESEAAVLGGLMLDGRRVSEVAERLCEDDFYIPRNRAIYRAILSLSGQGKPFDTVTMMEWFAANGVGGDASSYALNISNNTPSSANVLAYADIVRKKAALRGVIDDASAAVEDAFAGGDEDVLDDLIGKLIKRQKIDTRHEFTLRQAMSIAYKAAQEAAKHKGCIVGIPSGIKRIDELLGGWHNSDLSVIGARPSMGKTALLLNFAVACKVPSGIISAEQPAQQVGARVMSIESKVDALKLRNGNLEAEELGSLSRAVARLVETPCMVYDRSSPSISDVIRITRKWKTQHGIRILFVDYVQRIEGVDRREKRFERVGEVVRGLKDLARDLEIPVVALCQVGRQVDARPNKRPNMGDMSDSSEIEKEADQILTLYRDEVYDENSQDAGIAEISVEKNRHGPTGLVKCAWIGPSMRFENLGYAA